ncbi:MAG: hypothetical protein U0790_12375 [Isosphaeraceae bacterium]
MATPPPKSVEDSSRKRHWWRDPIWLATFLLCSSVVAGAYLYWRASQRREAIKLQAHLFKWQGDLVRDQDPSGATRAYETAIRWIRDQGRDEPELQGEIPELQAKIDELSAKAKQSGRK